MAGGISFQESDRDQVEDMWRQILDLERQGMPGWQRRSEQNERGRGGVSLTIRYANGAEVELARHNLPEGGFRDVVMRVTLPARDERREVPPSPANEANRRLLGGQTSDLLLAGQPVVVRARAQMEALFGRRPGDEARRLLQPAARTATEAAQDRLPLPRPVVARYPNTAELDDIQRAMTVILSGQGVEITEDRGMPAWLCRHQFTTDGTEGGFRAGSEAFAILYRLQAAVLAADRKIQEADQRAARDALPNSSGMRRRLLDTE